MCKTCNDSTPHLCGACNDHINILITLDSFVCKCVIGAYFEIINQTCEGNDVYIYIYIYIVCHDYCDSCLQFGINTSIASDNCECLSLNDGVVEMGDECKCNKSDSYYEITIGDVLLCNSKYKYDYIYIYI